MEKTSTYYTGRFLPSSWLRHDLGGLYTFDQGNAKFGVGRAFISLFFFLGD
jgi:hypothetical protein